MVFLFKLTWIQEIDPTSSVTDWNSVCVCVSPEIPMKHPFKSPNIPPKSRNLPRLLVLKIQILHRLFDLKVAEIIRSSHEIWTGLFCGTKPQKNRGDLQIPKYKIHKIQCWSSVILYYLRSIRSKPKFTNFGESRTFSTWKFPHDLASFTSLKPSTGLVPSHQLEGRYHRYVLGLPPTQDASQKWRFRLGDPY